jgi:type II secretory pathway component PulF
VKFSAKTLAEFYYQLGTMVQAGVPIKNALESLRRTAPRPMRKCVSTLAMALESGEPLQQAIARFPRQFAAVDRQTLAVGEQSGALDIGLLALSQYHDARAKARSRIVSASMLPALLLTAAVFISRLPQLVLGALGQTQYSVLDYLIDTVGFLGLLVAVGLALRWLAQRLLRTPGVNVTVDHVLRAVPLFGRLRFDYALSQWLSSIRLMLNAGFAIFEALDYASETSPSPLIAHAYQKARPLIHSQMDVSAALQSTHAFPDQLIQFWATGEQSGRMDEMLDRLARLYEERWRRSLDQLATWLPRIAYALVSLYIIFQIFKLMMPIIDMYQQLLQ